MAFQPPNSRELANRKILEELQIKKQMLLKQGAAPIASAPLNIASALPGNTLSPGSEHLSTIQRGAVLQAQASFGFFVPQDTLFGNVILPVLPRFDSK